MRQLALSALAATSLLASVAQGQAHDPNPAISCVGEVDGIWNLEESQFHFSTSRLPLTGARADGREEAMLRVEGEPAARFLLTPTDTGWEGISEVNPEVVLAITLPELGDAVEVPGELVFNDWKNENLQVPLSCYVYRP